MTIESNLRRTTVRVKAGSGWASASAKRWGICNATPPFAPVSCKRVEHLHAGSFEIAHIACNDCQVVFESGRGDHRVQHWERSLLLLRDSERAFGFRLDERWGKASFLIDGAGSTSGAAPCTSSSANRYFASWPPCATV